MRRAKKKSSGSENSDYLADYTEFHFGEEEKLQESINYPAIAEHKKEHDKLRAVVKDLYNMLEEEEGPSEAFVEQVNKNVISGCIDILKVLTVPWQNTNL